MTSLRVLAVTSEIYPIIKTGGLADVVGALPVALRACGIETRTLVPGYPDVIKALLAAEVLLHWPHFYGGPIRLLGGSHEDLDLLAGAGLTRIVVARLEPGNFDNSPRVDDFG